MAKWLSSFMKINMQKIKKYLLIIILVIGALLRVWNLGNIPPSLTPDEAALGYNAYSILKTGKDEYGKLFPIIFKSFGDYKPGFYIYLTVPFVAVLGLNEYAVRLPSALGGVLSVYFIYLIVKKLFNNEKLSLSSAFIAAINPWSIFFSRGAWEVNIALTLTLAGIYFFFVSLEKQKYIFLSVISFALTLITYQGAKLSTGIVVIILGILYWRDLIKFRVKAVALSLVAGFVISIPIVMSFFQGGTGRLTVFSVFSYPRPKEYIQAFLNEGSERIGDLNYFIFHSETLNFARGVLGRYFNHLSPRFLFFEGDWGNPQHSSPYQGQLLLADVVLLIVGAITLIKHKFNKGVLFIWLWLFLSPLPSILSRDQIHAVRALNMSVPLIIILGLGMNKILELSKLWKILFLSLYSLAFIYYLDSYFVHLPVHNSEYWQYGYKQMVEKVIPVKSKYMNVRVQQSFAQPYIYFLFFGKYDPATYQKGATLIASEYANDVGYVAKLDNVIFVPVDWSIDRGDHGDLVIADPMRIPVVDSSDPREFNLLGEVKYLNNVTAFRMVEVKQKGED